jgi:hypothetical protein
VSLCPKIAHTHTRTGWVSRNETKCYRAISANRVIIKSKQAHKHRGARVCCLVLPEAADLLWSLACTGAQERGAPFFALIFAPSSKQQPTSEGARPAESNKLRLVVLTAENSAAAATKAEHPAASQP